MPHSDTNAAPLADGLALIFDMDGVILDSNPLHRESWSAFSRRYGVETTPAMLERMYGRRNDQIVRDFFGTGLPEAEIAARGAAKEKLYREMLASRIEEVLVPGIRDFLDRHGSVPMAIATNAEPENVNFVLDRAGLRGYFRVVVDGHQVTHPKPHPEIYLRAAELLHTPPENCIVVEDSITGVEAAKAAGMRVLGIATTYVNLPGADAMADNFCNGNIDAWLKAQQRAR
ncbi:MAG TPA: beta-phosphoglucomutase family hydrolase [Bryobacteraceae bacterium]|nr:beta-phosphoglucomutase family hydrolase [Bryobacteraceae bacterium]